MSYFLLKHHHKLLLPQGVIVHLKMISAAGKILSDEIILMRSIGIERKLEPLQAEEDQVEVG